MSTIHLAAGAPLPKKILSGTTLLLQPGAYVGGLSWSGLRDVTIRGLDEGAEFPGSDGRDGLKFTACHGLRLENLKLPRWRKGLFIVDCSVVTIEGVDCNHCGAGILTGNTSDLTIQECECSDSTASHGIYLSQSGDENEILRCVTDRNAKCGIQDNAAQPKARRNDPGRDGISRACRLIGNRCRDNANAGINLAGVWDSLIEENEIEGGRGGIALFSDRGGKSCLSNVVRYNRIEGYSDYGIQVKRGCTGNHIYGHAAGLKIEAEEPYLNA